jgi:hypothetical protein
MFVQGNATGGEYDRRLSQNPFVVKHCAQRLPSTSVSPGRHYEQGRGDMEDWDSSRDGSHPDSPMGTSTGKRKSTDDRQPESPAEIERHHAPNNWHREKQYRSHHEHMDTDSPSSYPKHMMLPPGESNSRYSRGGPPPYHHEILGDKSQMSPPLLTPEAGMHGGYEPPMYRPNYYHQGQDQGHGHGHGYEHGHNDGGQYNGHSPPRQSRHYMPEMHTPPNANYGPPGQGPPRRWACDFCSVATFLNYEEACTHEEACGRRHHEHYGRVHQSRGPVPQYDRAPPGPHGDGLGALYHASQEVGGPPVPHRKPMWSTNRGPPIPPLPHHPNQVHHHGHHGYQTPPRYHGYGGYERREGHSPMHSPMHRNGPYRKPETRMLLAMPTDTESLSDRQCYVRSEMVEIFAATEKDVSARHSKGAQKLAAGQVGIRCVHCAHLRPRDRAERAVCYPSSISRIYQTVADMQRFHFEQCREIPNETRKIYKSLKTTRPRGVGSPQTYWIQSAKLLDLADSGDGIRFNTQEVKQPTDTSS